jgi:3-methyladenine DNA glycosylase AlkD
MAKPKPTAARRAFARSTPGPTVAEVLAWLERTGTREDREGMARYGIVAARAFGVPVGALRKKGKELGRSHELAAALWASGWYEARLLAAFVDDPARVTPAQMDRWARDFENWADCDTVCFHLFDKTPHALARVAAWAKRREEFVKRAAFALLASVALHDKALPDGHFAKLLPLVERGAADDRNFVKKGVLWALRGIGERSPALRAEALAVARRLAAADGSAERWVGRSALRELNSAAATRRLAAQRARTRES